MEIGFWIVLIIIVAIIVNSLLSMNEIPKEYQVGLDKILPLDQGIRGTRVETYRGYVVARGEIINTSRKEGWFGDDYRCEHHVKFQDGKSLLLNGSNTDTFLEGGINRIVFSKSSNYISKISYR